MKKEKLLECVNSSMDDILARNDSGNPLEVWTRFIDLLDVRGRASIGDDLERQGRNRYTGKEEKSNDQCNVKPSTALERESPEW